MAQTIKINDKEYDLESFSEKARTQLVNVRVADQRIVALEQELALVKTARAAYARVLQANMPKDE